GAVDLLLGGETLEPLRLGSLVAPIGVDRLGLRLDDIRLRRAVAGARLRHRGVEELRVELGDHLALGHLAVEVGEELGDAARYLATDLDRDARLEGAGGGDARGDRATLDLLRRVDDLRRAVRSTVKPESDAPRNHHAEDDPGDPLFHLHGPHVASARS